MYAAAPHMHQQQEELQMPFSALGSPAAVSLQQTLQRRATSTGKKVVY
jgi:hypothetical protein